MVRGREGEGVCMPVDAPALLSAIRLAISAGDWRVVPQLLLGSSCPSGPVPLLLGPRPLGIAACGVHAGAGEGGRHSIFLCVGE